jgi:hypothetical protein
MKKIGKQNWVTWGIQLTTKNKGCYEYRSLYESNRTNFVAIEQKAKEMFKASNSTAVISVYYIMGDSCGESMVFMPKYPNYQIKPYNF